MLKALSIWPDPEHTGLFLEPFFDCYPPCFFILPPVTSKFYLDVSAQLLTVLAAWHSTNTVKSVPLFFIQTPVNKRSYKLWATSLLVFDLNCDTQRSTYHLEFYTELALSVRLIWVSTRGNQKVSIDRQISSNYSWAVSRKLPNLFQIPQLQGLSTNMGE